MSENVVLWTTHSWDIENLNVIDAKFETLLIPIAEDIPLYKNYVENRFLHVTTVAHGRLTALQGSIDIAGSNFDTADNQFRAIEDAMNRLHESMQLLQVQMASVGNPVGNPQPTGHLLGGSKRDRAEMGNAGSSLPIW